MDTAGREPSLRARRRANLRRLLHPRHVAIIGGALVEDAVAVCRAAGFAGELWPVSRRAAAVSGTACYPSVEALPDAPDATLVMASPQATVDMVGALAHRGAGGVVCYASGFAESGEEGRRRQVAIVSAANDLAVVGPNCNGLASFIDNLVLWPNPELPLRPVKRGVAILSQSGAVAVNICNGERSLPVAIAISIGNQAVVDIADYIDVLLQDDRITAIGAYLESVPDGPALSRAALAAAAKGVPLVVLKAGWSEIGAQRAATHTGAMVAADAVAAAFLERHGIVRVGSVSGLVETLKMLAVAGAPHGPRLAAIAVSGGVATLIADAAARVGLALPLPEPVRMNRLAQQIPSGLSVANPLDCSPPLKAESGIAMLNQPALEECFRTMAEGPCDMAALFIDFPHAEVRQSFLWEPCVRAMTAVARGLGKPCAVGCVMPEALPHDARELLVAAGVAPLQGLDDALQALAGAARWSELRQSALTRGEPMPCLPSLTGPLRVLDEVESKLRLAAAGLPVVKGRLATPEDAAAVATSLGYPVAIKAVSAALPHKAKAGAVTLWVRDAGAARAEALRVIDAAAAAGPLTNRVLVERMVTGAAAEVIVGVKRQEPYGLVMILGAGGVHVEGEDDHAVILLPAKEADVAQSLGRLRIGRSLARHGVPLDALVAAATAIGRFALASSAELGELDVNPLLVMRDGAVVIVDALMGVVQHS